ncbi:DUF930 domain-containing protein [Pleomorphomonas sp. NRK KF1]|uniref:DUF930 domain-containing protein n=1 Tax=Pleomorphomonas sp. NRK KF1 TaxID=2943000 RepID=UPI0020446E53|nr:DUF930 domain-containing protein [Pleomorphomonas sp. NRK KF1]MCM5552506.1 DUF930 domain-containing protein [Pleomorphomonas sp. NRK KF1]
MSVLGHVLVITLLAIEAPRHFTVEQQPLAVDVVMVPPVEVVPDGGPASEPAATLPEGTAKPSPLPVRPSTGGRITATDYFAAAVLDDPRNRETRETISTLTSDERLIQLCNIEAMEQLKHWKAGFVPNSVVPYATADPLLKAASMEAPGAAVHAGGKWYRLSFACGATADLTRVASFSFKLGRPIPQREWEQNSLPELVEGEPTD